jgi:hypothetical protein
MKQAVSGMTDITPEEVVRRIQEFNKQHEDVRSLAHIVLEDNNLNHESIVYVISEFLPPMIDAWVDEQTKGYDDPVTRMLNKARVWSEVWALTSFLNWLMYDVPLDVLDQAENMLSEIE